MRPYEGPSEASQGGSGGVVPQENDTLAKRREKKVLTNFFSFFIRNRLYFDGSF